MRLLLAWTQAVDGVPKRVAAARLLTASMVVEAAQAAHYLGVEPITDAALRIIEGALDAANAPAVLLLARSLGAARLEERSACFIVSELEAVVEHAGWDMLPPLARATLRALRDAAVANPIFSCRRPHKVARTDGNSSGCGARDGARGGGGGCGEDEAEEAGEEEEGVPVRARLLAGMSSDPREMLGMVRESLDMQCERLAEARTRQRREPRVEGDGEVARRQRQTLAALDLQSERIHALRDYLQRHNTSFCRLLGVGSAPEGPLPAIHIATTPTPEATVAPKAPANRQPPAAFPPQPSAAASPQSVAASTSSSSSAAGFAPSAAMSSAPLVPTYDWQTLGAEQQVPPGLEVETPLDGRPRRARIPSLWTLTLWLGRKHGTLRVRDVGRHTCVGEVHEAVAAALGLTDEHVRIGLKEASGSKFPSRRWAAGTSDVFVPEASAEAVDLFNQQQRLAVWVLLFLTSLSASVVSGEGEGVAWVEVAGEVGLWVLAEDL